MTREEDEEAKRQAAQAELKRATEKAERERKQAEREDRLRREALEQAAKEKAAATGTGATSKNNLNRPFMSVSDNVFEQQPERMETAGAAGGDANGVIVDATDEVVSQYAEALRGIQAENVRQAVYNSIQGLASLNLGSTVNPNAVARMSDGTYRNTSMANKLVSQIPKYGKKTNEYTWNNLMTHLRMIQNSNVYSSEELKLILFQAFECPAFDYVSAHPEIFETTFQEALKKLNDVFGKSKAENVAEVTTIVQQIKEPVELYEARMINAAGRLKPELPHPIKIQIASDGQKTVVSNPSYVQELAEYEGQSKLLQTLLQTQFLGGLRPEIRRQMRAEDYATFADAKKAARDAERFLEISQPQTVGHVQVAEGIPVKAEVNAVNFEKGKEQLRKMEGGKREFRGICYGCNQEGHMKRNCPLRKKKSHSPGRSPYPDQGGNYGQGGGYGQPGDRSRYDTQYDNRGRSPQRRSQERYQSGYRSGSYERKNQQYKQGQDKFVPRRTNSPYRHPRDCSKCRYRGRSCSRHVGQYRHFRPRTPSRERARRVYHIGESHVMGHTYEGQQPRNEDPYSGYQGYQGYHDTGGGPKN